jgi:hypothetical protein
MREAVDRPHFVVGQRAEHQRLRHGAPPAGGGILSPI